MNMISSTYGWFASVMLVSGYAIPFVEVKVTGSFSISTISANRVTAQNPATAEAI